MSRNTLNALVNTVTETSERLPGQGPGPGGPPRISPFLNARHEDLILLFQWFQVSTWGTFVAGLVTIFIASVILTVVSLILQQYERESLSRHKNLSAIRRLLGGISFMFRMAMVYIAVLVATIRSLWFLSVLLLGHFVGWVIFSSDAVVAPILGVPFDDDDDDKRPKKDKHTDDSSSLDSV